MLVGKDQQNYTTECLILYEIQIVRVIIWEEEGVSRLYRWVMVNRFWCIWMALVILRHFVFATQMLQVQHW
jgi:hypothetical protein